MSQPLSGKVALVTGATRGIGRSIALGLAAVGVDIAVNYRAGTQDAEGLVAEIVALGRRATAVRADVSDPDAVTDMVSTIRRELGPVDVLVNNAGIARPLKLESIHLAKWDATFAVNLRAPFTVTSAVLPEMRARGWGRLLYLSSTASRGRWRRRSALRGIRGGPRGPRPQLASILAKEGITANAIAPALIETEMLAGNVQVNPDRIPVGRFGTAEEVADIVVAVACNGYITGQTIHVNGGIYMT